ncbi:MAG: N-acetylmuramoyl-L-alanine amidase, partial [Caldilineae bacterium]
MPVPYGENLYIYGLHDRDGEDLMEHQGRAKGWVVVTEEIRANPHDTSGGDYRDLADRGFGVIVRLNHAYGSDGTIPRREKYDDFARRAANFVRNSKGAHIWIVGNEMNLEREQPRLPNSNHAERITPRRYAECYKKVREAIKSVPGHADDQVIVGAIGPWNGETSYDADPQGAYPANKIADPNAPAPAGYPYHGFFGDYIRYLRDMLLAIGRENCDGIAIHAYTHGYDPTLVFSDVKMGKPFQKYYLHFRTYRDQMNAIPFPFRDLPVYLTEMNGDQEGDAPWADGSRYPEGTKWPDVNKGWVKNAYREINDWNRAGNQQIRCAVLYRWSEDDDWSIKKKTKVHQDFKEAVALSYTWDPNVRPSAPSLIDLPIEDVSAKLPVNPSLPPYPRRQRSAIRRIVFHHTGVESSKRPNLGPKDIAEIQIANKKYPRRGIAYHYYITPEGDIYQTQPLEVVSDHAGEFSASSVGICLHGHFSRERPKEGQLAAAAALVAKLAGELGLPVDGETVVGHSELRVTESPGKTWPEWKPTLLDRARRLAG